VPTSKGERTEGEKGRKRIGRGKGGEGGRGKDDWHPTLFLGPEACCVLSVCLFVSNFTDEIYLNILAAMYVSGQGGTVLVLVVESSSYQLHKTTR